MIALLFCLGLFDSLARDVERNIQAMTELRQSPNIGEMICGDQWYSVTATSHKIDAREVHKVAHSCGKLDRLCIINVAYTEAETECVALYVTTSPGAHRIWLTCSDADWEEMLIRQLAQFKRKPKTTERMK